MKIEVFYFNDCPNYEHTVELIESVVDELGVSADVDLIRVETHKSAAEKRFLGSPTVQVNGLDVDPAARERTDYGLACRRYRDGGVPPRDMIITALSHGGKSN